jgi:hypothetical protein
MLDGSHEARDFIVFPAQHFDKALTVMRHTFVFSFSFSALHALHEHTTCLDGELDNFQQPELSSLMKLVCLHLRSVFDRSLIFLFLSIIATEHGMISARHPASNVAAMIR